jgi:hypothetical protein
MCEREFCDDDVLSVVPAVADTDFGEPGTVWTRVLVAVLLGVCAESACTLK